MGIEILTIGGEILTGRTPDSNFGFLARSLAHIGAVPTWHTTVPDSREVLGDALRLAIERADGVITTGGLGATPDDLTRRVLSQVLGRKLVLDESVWEAIRNRYREAGRPPPTSGQMLALVPQGAEVLPNPVGLAPGLLLAGERGWICALPGVPSEMRALAERFLLPFVERRQGGVRGSEIVLRTAGVPETVLAERLGTRHPGDLEIAYLPGGSGVDLRLIRGAGSAISDREFRAWASAIRERLGEAVYGEEQSSLEGVVGELLVERRLRLAVAESLTGGAVGAALTRVPGSSRYFLGGIAAYDDDVKRRVLRVSGALLRSGGAVSGAVAESMAAGARRLLGAEIGVSTTGIAGPTGGTAEKPVGLVYLGLSTPAGEAHLRRRFPGPRESVTRRTVAASLLLLYRHLRGLPIEGSPFGDAAGESRGPEDGERADA